MQVDSQGGVRTERRDHCGCCVDNSWLGEELDLGGRAEGMRQKGPGLVSEGVVLGGFPMGGWGCESRSQSWVLSWAVRTEWLPAADRAKGPEGGWGI